MDEISSLFFFFFFSLIAVTAKIIDHIPNQRDNPPPFTYCLYNHTTIL